MNQSSCTPWTVCQPGEYIANPGSTTDDQGCDVCGAGTFSSTTDAPSCQAWQDCASGTFEQEMLTSTTDRMCTARIPELASVGPNA